MAATAPIWQWDASREEYYYFSDHQNAHIYQHGYRINLSSENASNSQENSLATTYQRDQSTTVTRAREHREGDEDEDDESDDDIGAITSSYNPDTDSHGSAAYTSTTHDSTPGSTQTRSSGADTAEEEDATLTLKKIKGLTNLANNSAMFFRLVERLFTPVVFVYLNDHWVQTSSWLDAGASGNCLSLDFARRNRLETRLLVSDQHLIVPRVDRPDIPYLTSMAITSLKWGIEGSKFRSDFYLVDGLPVDAIIGVTTISKIGAQEVSRKLVDLAQSRTADMLYTIYAGKSENANQGGPETRPKRQAFPRKSWIFASNSFRA